MSMSSKLGGLKRTKWENKSPKQAKKILTRHFENLGYKLPSYLQKDKITSSDFSKAMNRIITGYDKAIVKEKTTKRVNKIKQDKPKRKKIPLMEKLEKQVIKHNIAIDNALDNINKNFNLSKKALDYIKGKHVFSSIRNKSFFTDNGLHHISLKNRTFENDEQIKSEIRRLQNETKKLSNKNILERMTNEERHDKWFDSFLDDEYFDDLDEGSKDILKMHFSRLTPIQKEIAIKSELGDLREKYKNKGDNGESVSVNNLFDRTNLIILNTQNEF